MIAMIFICIIGKKLEKKSQTRIVCCILSIGLVLIFVIKGFNLQLVQPTMLQIIETQLADVGARFGYSLFSIILAGIGVYYLWKEKQMRYWNVGLTLFLVFITIAKAHYYAIYLNIIVCILASIGFLRLTKRTWKITNLRNITLFLLILGVVYSGTVVVARNATADPEPEIMHAMIWLRQHSEENAVILSAEQYSFMIQQTTKRNVIITKKTDLSAEAEIARKDINTLYDTRSIDIALDTLYKYDVTYVVVTEEMKKGLIWTRDDQGLLFLLDNGEKFKKVFENNKVTIWEVVY